MKDYYYIDMGKDSHATGLFVKCNHIFIIAWKGEGQENIG